MWKMVCSLAWQLIPSTVVPAAAVDALASGAPAGTGTPSGPDGPGDGAGSRVPSALTGPSLSPGVPPPPPAEPLLLVTASVIPTAAMITTTAAPIPASQ